jgi:hypothetical protein
VLGMTTIRSGSTPRRHRPRSAASLGDIATVGSSCSGSLTTTSGQRRRSTVSTSCRSTPSCEISTNAMPSPPAMPAHPTSRQDRLCRAILSRTSRQPRRSRRTASGRPADECIGMMARLDVAASADHRHMPFHQPRIITRRHHTHAADRHEYGQPSPPRHGPFGFKRHFRWR